MAPWSELTGLVVTRYYTPSSLLQNVLIFIWMLLYYMPASNGRHILPLSSLTLIPIPRSSLSSRAGTMTESNHSFLPHPAQRRNGSCQNILSEVLGLGLRSGSGV